ncbi:MAG: EamA family transporter [Hyphomicrobium sp.]|nr:MAG: EamA family transporter [Hyphomicrobium sp.]
MPLRDMLAALVAVTAFGTSFVAIKSGVEHMPPLLLTALRFLFAALPAILFVPPPRTRPVLVVAFGLAFGVGLFGAMFIAIKLGMPAGLAAIVVQLQVFFTMGLAWLLDRERPGHEQMAGAVIALVGMGLIGWQRFAGAATLPFFLVLAAAGFWAFANFVSKRAGASDRLALVVWGSLVAAPVLIGLSLLIEGSEAVAAALLPPAWSAVASVVFMAYPATLLAFSIWTTLLSRYPTPVVAPFALLIPVVGLLSTHMAFGERLAPLEVVASGLILIGLLVGLRGASLPRPSSP